MWVASSAFTSLPALTPSVSRATVSGYLSCGAVRRCGSFPYGCRFLRLPYPEHSAKSKCFVPVPAGKRKPRPQARCRSASHIHATKKRSCRWGTDPRWRACPIPAGSGLPATFHGRGAAPSPTGSFWPRCGVPPCRKRHSGSAYQSHCGGSFPSFHPLSVGDFSGSLPFRQRYK